MAAGGSSEETTRLMLHAMDIRVTKLETQFDAFRQTFREEVDETQDEQRTVHNIVEATNEAIRNVARDVGEMKPYVKEYSLAASSLKNAVTSLRGMETREAEERGARKERAKTKAIVISAMGVIGTGMMYLVSKFLEWLIVFMTSKPK